MINNYKASVKRFWFCPSCIYTLLSILCHHDKFTLRNWSEFLVHYLYNRVSHLNIHKTAFLTLQQISLATHKQHLLARHLPVTAVLPTTHHTDIMKKKEKMSTFINQFLFLLRRHFQTLTWRYETINCYFILLITEGYITFTTKHSIGHFGSARKKSFVHIEIFAVD